GVLDGLAGSVDRDCGLRVELLPVLQKLLDLVERRGAPLEGAHVALGDDARHVLLGRGLEPDAQAALEQELVGRRVGDQAAAGGDHRALMLAEHAVIATGGSLVTDASTYQFLLERCLCIWLKASPEEHMARVIAQGDMRPFKGRSAALDEIKKLLEDRKKLYAQAAVTVDTSGKTVKHT